jgi:hypothetical protein
MLLHRHSVQQKRINKLNGKPASGGEAPEPRQRVPRTVAPGNGDGKKEGRTGTAVASCVMDVYTM